MGYGASACPRCGLIQSGVVSAVEANDKLTELKAERDEARRAAVHSTSVAEMERRDREAAEAQRNALADALQEIARMDDFAAMQHEAKAALDKLGED